MNEIKQKTVDVAKKEVDITEFNARMDAAQKWAKEVGLTEQDIYEVIQEVRRENSEKRQSL